MFVNLRKAAAVLVLYGGLNQMIFLVILDLLESYEIKFQFRIYKGINSQE